MIQPDLILFPYGVYKCPNIWLRLVFLALQSIILIGGKCTQISRSYQFPGFCHQGQTISLTWRQSDF